MSSLPSPPFASGEDAPDTPAENRCDNLQEQELEIGEERAAEFPREGEQRHLYVVDGRQIAEQPRKDREASEDHRDRLGDPAAPGHRDVPETNAPRFGIRQGCFGRRAGPAPASKRPRLAEGPQLVQELRIPFVRRANLVEELRVRSLGRGLILPFSIHAPPWRPLLLVFRSLLGSGHSGTSWQLRCAAWMIQGIVSRQPGS